MILNTASAEDLKKVKTELNSKADKSALNNKADKSELETKADKTELGTVLTGTLTAGDTDITLSSNKITTDSTVDFYTDKYGVNPIDATVTNGSVTLVFKAQETDLSVKAVIK